MTPSCLIVPLNVTALAVNKDVRTKEKFWRWMVDFKDREPRHSPESPPGNTTEVGGDDDWFVGTHLHWEIPAALARARVDLSAASGPGQPKPGAVTFPLVPNRWLVLRHQYTGDGTKLGTAGWVVHSDYLSDEEGTNPYLVRNGGKPRVTRIGRSVELDKWRDPGDQPFLSVVGAGLPTFASYQPYNQDVFSLQDHFAGDSTKESYRLSYLVVGWHSRDIDEPLTDANLRALLAFRGESPEKMTDSQRFAAGLAALGWTDADGKTLPITRRCLYVGTALDIGWEPEGHFPSDIPDVKMNVPDAAVGNGVVDARTALDNRTDPEARRWSEAFEYGVLDRLDDAWLDGGQDILDAEAHATWFADSAAGYAWSAVDRPDSGVSPNSGIPEEIASEQQIVEQLNKDQRAYDDALRDLAIARERLHALWWLAGLSDDELEDRKAPADFRARVKEQLDPDFAGSLAGQVGDLVFRCVGDETTTGLRDAVPQGATPDELARSIAAYEAKVKLPPARTLRRTPLPPYRRGTDPLTLLRGDGMRVDLPSTAPVPVRAATRLIAKMTGANPITPPIPVPTPNGYEALKKALSWAPLEAAVAEFWTLAEAAARINDTPSVEPDKSFDAALERLGFTPGDAESGKTTTGWFTRLWRQYWAPMYLWWQAHCYPLHYDSGGTKYWTFDGRRHCWTGGEAPGAKFVEGRSLLTGAPPFALAGRVDQYINTLADPYGEVAAKLRKMLAERENRDQVAQGLAGLDPWFAERDQANHFDPFDGTSAALLTPQPTVALPGKGQYQPIRAGQLYFEKLVVVDRFGRGVDLVRGNPDAFRPRRSRDVKPDLDSKGVPLTVESENRDRFVQFRPRLAQPARTLLELVHSRDDDVALRPWDSPRYAGAPDPICGWLVPDRGGRSLFVLAADGTGIGELLVTDDPDGPRVAWLPLPGSTVLTIDQLLSPEFAEAHPHLGPLLSGVLTRTDAAAALNDLIATIDTALQTIAPPANHSPAYRSVFTGLPLAVVRARLRIELSGPPIYAAEWKRILAGPDTDDGNPLRTIRWQVRLGDPWRRTDGLIGFCRPRAPEKAHDTDYNTLFIPHSHALSESDYLQPTDGLSDPVVVATEPPAEVEHSRPATGEPGAAWITALVAPWAPVHAYTGVLPVTTAQVPEAFLSDPLARMSVFLRTGPLPAGLRSPGPDLPEGIALPVPTGTRGTWAWSERTEPDALYPWADYTFAGTETAVRPPDEPPVARTGYLRFTPNPVGDAGPTPINREGRQP